ncbi:FIG01005481: hypothetical protein [hydrothermal vent metagenome]|uniref:VWFA domain-containing protein n=1 Tax=hydrothermal vent metagenome TaxID=652676 RepID=A0A3B1BA06_9ZZZZ
MKTRLLTFALFAVTAITVTFYPAMQSNSATSITPHRIEPVITIPFANERPKIEVVFVLDTTGSMGGLIQAAKEKIWSIATTMASAQSAPEIKMGLVAYRDRGDQYVTRVIDLSADLDSVYASLMDFQAQGGGDGPESVNQALDDAVTKISWSQDQDTYKVVFLIGDAPPHMDYQDDVKYPISLKTAHRNGIVINTIQCGKDHSTSRDWQQIAQLGGGNYFQVEQTGSAIAMTTPYDNKLATLSEELDDTRLYYGSAEEKVRQAKKQAATKKLHAAGSMASRARRAAFNTTVSGAENLLGEKELVDGVTSGKVDLADLKQEMLPASIQALAPAEQQAAIKEKAERRKELLDEMKQLNKQRSSYLKDKVAASGDANDSLDHKIYRTLKAQAEKKGIMYESETPEY